MLFDGMGIADPNGVSIIYMVNTAFSSETVLETGGGNAESKATMVMNLIPEEGGNRFSGMFDARYSNDGLQADNLDQNLIDQGVTFTNEMLKFYNVDATLGGPIAEDRGVVLPGIPRGPQPEHRARRLLQQQHREPDARIHRGPDPQGVPHGMDAEPRRTGHGAGLGEKQDRRLRRLPVVLQSGPGGVLLAGGLPAPVQPVPRAVAPGHLDVAGVEPAPARGRLLEHARPLAVSVAGRRRVRVRSGRHPHARADHGLPVERAELLRRRNQEAPLLRAGLAVVRHRVARLQGRVPAGARHLGVPVRRARRRVVLPSERRPEPDSPARDILRPQEGAHDPAGDLRPGPVDAAPHDAQPRSAVGRLQRTGAGPELSPPPRSSRRGTSRRSPTRSASRTSIRGSASPTTWPATAGRRSSSPSGATWRRG